jgi:hypothetical protein
MSNKGRRIDPLPTTFKITLEDRMRAAAGLPAHIRRKRRIEDLQDATVLALEQIFEEAEAEFGKGSDEAEREFLKRAAEIDLQLLNDLIDRHNRYYPIEANLPIDVKTGALLQMGRPWQPLGPVTHEQFVARVRALRGGK